MLKAVVSSQYGKIAILVIGLAVLVVSVILLLQPKPFSTYVPADSIGFLEFPDAGEMIRYFHNPHFLEGTSLESQASLALRRMDTLLKPFDVSEQQMSGIQVGLILTSASAEPLQTIRINGVLLVRVHSFWVKTLRLSPRSIAEKLSSPSASVETETLLGKDVSVLRRSSPDQRIFIAVHRDAVLLSNQREALASVLSTMDGNAPSITISSAWKATPPGSNEHSMARGFFVGSSLVNILRDYLIRNYSPFENSVRTSRFLATLGLEQIQAIHYKAQIQASGIEETWRVRVASPAPSSPSLVSVFVHQRGSGLESFPAGAFPSGMDSARVVSIVQSQEMWNILANALGVLTAQEAPQNRDLMIAMLEGAIGIRVQRDLLSHLSGAIAYIELEPRPNEPSVGKKIVPPQAARRGWLVAIATKDPNQVERAFSKIIVEGHPPKSQRTGSVTVFYADVGSKSRRPFSEVLSDVPAYAVLGDLLYFSTDKDVLISAMESLQRSSKSFRPAIPPQIDAHAPYLSFTLTPGLESARGSRSQSPSSDQMNLSSISEIKEADGGFEFLRISPGGFVCDLFLQATETLQ